MSTKKFLIDQLIHDVGAARLLAAAYKLMREQENSRRSEDREYRIEEMIEWIARLDIAGIQLLRRIAEGAKHNGKGQVH